mgnify:CR=1 FL=1
MTRGRFLLVPWLRVVVALATLASLGVLAPLAALAAAIAFTRWYPSHVRARSS